MGQGGVFEQLHLEILDRPGLVGRLDWSRAGLDSMTVRAKQGGPRWRKPGPGDLVQAVPRERWPRPATVNVRHRGGFAYVTGELADGASLPLCRLRQP